jgi:hypothetical protein
MAPSFGRMACTMLMLQLFGTTKLKRWGLWFIFWQSLIVNLVVLILIYAQCEDVQSLVSSTFILFINDNRVSKIFPLYF